MTAEIINLNKVRKARERADAERQAEENRAKSGRTKVEKTNAEAAQQTRDRMLDGARIKTPRLDDSHDDLDPGNVS